MDMKSGEVTIRWAKQAEWKPAVMMIWRTFLKYECNYTREGIDTFYRFLSDDDLHMAFLRGRYHLLVAECGGEIVGACSLRNGNFLSLLFVESEYHRRGIGQALVEEMCRHVRICTEHKEITVMASPYAVDFYKKLGFEAVGPEETVSGIRKTDMKKYLL